MTIVRVRFTPNGVPTAGRIRFQLRHDKDQRPLVSGRDILNGRAEWETVPVEGAEIEVRPTEPGFHCVIRAEALGHNQVNGTFLIPTEGPVDFDGLVRYDPKAGMAYEPDPEWWAWAKRLDDIGGVPGDSAYELAVKNGFTGTEAEWVASLEPVKSLATQAEPGLMPNQDKAKLDAATSAASGLALIRRDSNGRAYVTPPVEPAHIATKSYVDEAAMEAASDDVVATFVGTEGTATRRALVSAYGTRKVIEPVLQTWAASSNRAAINDAYAIAQAEGLTLQLPGGDWNIAGTVRFDAGPVNVHCPDRVRLHQLDKPNTVIQVTTRVHITGELEVSGEGLDMTGAGSGINIARHSGIWFDAGSDFSTVEYVKGYGLHRVVRVDPDSTASATPGTVPNLRGIELGKVVADDTDRCWAAVSAVGFDDLKIGDVRGAYAKAFGTGSDTGAPPHLVYVIDREQSSGRLNYNLTIESGMAWDSGVMSDDNPGEPALAYAIKGVRGFTYGNLHARNCAGILDIMNVSHVSPGTAVSIDDVYPQDGARGSVALRSTVGTHIRASVSAKPGGDYGRQVYFEGGTVDCLVEGEFVARPSTPRTGAITGVVRIGGTRNELRARVTNLGASMQSAISVMSGSSRRAIVTNPVIEGSFRYPVELWDGIGHLVEYDSMRVIADPGAGSGAQPVFTNSLVKGAVIRDRAAADMSSGYFDTFSGAEESALVSTDDLKPYVFLNNSTWVIRNGAPFCNYAPNGGGWAFPNMGGADGVITVKIKSVGTARDGIIFRTDFNPSGGASFPQDGLRVIYLTNSTDPRPQLQSRTGGASWTTVDTAPAGVAIGGGDTLTIHPDGQSVEVRLNGTLILSHTDTTHGNRVASGLHASSSGNGQWGVEEITFVRS